MQLEYFFTLNVHLQCQSTGVLFVCLFLSEPRSDNTPAFRNIVKDIFFVCFKELRKIILTNAFPLAGPHWSAAPSQHVLLGLWQSDPQLHERPGGFRTSAGERHRSLSFLLTLKINNRHPCAHSRVSVSSRRDAWGTDLFSSQPDQENLDLMSDPRRDESTSESIRCSPASQLTSNTVMDFSALERPLLPPCVHFRKAQQLASTWL